MKPFLACPRCPPDSERFQSLLALREHVAKHMGLASPCESCLRAQKQMSDFMETAVLRALQDAARRPAQAQEELTGWTHEDLRETTKKSLEKPEASCPVIPPHLLALPSIPPPPQLQRSDEDAVALFLAKIKQEVLEKEAEAAKGHAGKEEPKSPEQVGRGATCDPTVIPPPAIPVLPVPMDISPELKKDVDAESYGDQALCPTLDRKRAPGLLENILDGMPDRKKVKVEEREDGEVVDDESDRKEQQPVFKSFDVKSRAVSLACPVSLKSPEKEPRGPVKLDKNVQYGRRTVWNHACEYQRCCDTQCKHICAFCNGLHRDQNCATVVNFEQRRMIYLGRGICKNCGRLHMPNDRSPSCQSTCCCYCGSVGHAAALCPGSKYKLRLDTLYKQVKYPSTDAIARQKKDRDRLITAGSLAYRLNRVESSHRRSAEEEDRARRTSSDAVKNIPKPPTKG